MKHKLLQTIYRQPLAPFAHQSRVHRLRSFTENCYVKREDELGFGVSGSKIRKYLSLLPSILRHLPDEAILIGSAYSNHILSLSQLLKENGIEPILFVLGDKNCKLQGNLLYSTLIASTRNIHWASRGNWTQIDKIAEDFAKTRRQEHKKVIVVPKGGNCAESLAGSLTLAADILRNEEEWKLTFDHLFIDSGTGMTACALLLAFAYLKRPTWMHILLVAGREEEFLQTLAERKKDFEALIGESIPFPDHFKLYLPTNAPSFGTVNAAVFKTIAEIAQNEGFLTDPVFTAKLFYEGKSILNRSHLSGNILFLHSGGGLGLSGFQEQLAKALEGHWQ